MPTTRTVTLRRPPDRLLNPVYTTPASNAAQVLMSDGLTYLGRNLNRLTTSTDGGITPVNGKTFNTNTWAVNGIIETAGGEVLVTVKPPVGSTGEVWRSTGFNKATADATSWTRVLVSSGANAYCDGRWGFTQRSVAPSWSARPGAIFVAEYGDRFDDAADASQAGRKAWMSTDDGVTWQVIFDLGDHYATTRHDHIHGCAYDPWDDVVWVTQGDQDCGIWYAKGEAINGPATPWTVLPGSQNTANQSYWQTTTIIPMETSIVLLPDGHPYDINIIPRTASRTYGTLTSMLHLGIGVIGAHAWRNPGQPGAPLFMVVTSSNASGPPAVYSTVDGRQFFEVFRETTLVSGGANGYTFPLGPDLNGTVTIIRNLSGTGKVLQADYAADAALAVKVPQLDGNGPWYPGLAQETFSNPADSSGNMVSQSVWFTYFTALEDLTVQYLVSWTAAQAGTSVTVSRMGLFTVAANGDLTPVAATANTVGFWASGSTEAVGALAVAADLSTALTSYKVTAGQRYAIGLLPVFTGTAPRVLGKNGPAAHYATGGLNTIAVKLPRKSAILAAQTDLPTATVATASLTAQAFVPWAMVTAA